MFALAYVILPFSDTPPAEAIRASLAPFQRGQRGDLPESWLSFADETEALLEAYEAQLTITTQGTGGMRIEGGPAWHISTHKVRDEMQRLGLRRWNVRFADTMDINEFYDRFSKGLERHPNTGAFGRWLNPLGRWDWWDLGGRFDGRIMGDQRPITARSVAKLSSGANPGRIILTNIENRLARRLARNRSKSLDVQTDQNIELVATLFDDARSDRANAYPSSPYCRLGRSKTVCGGSIRGRTLSLKKHSPGSACHPKRTGRPSFAPSTRALRTTGPRV